MNTFKSFAKIFLKPFASVVYSLSKAKYDLPDLKEGVSAVVVARNESNNILMSLKSLIGFADQIICIDNGSSDGTLQKMKLFQQEYAGKILIEVIEAPGKLLGDCRNIGLSHSVYSWHLRWDADMVFRQEIGNYNSAWLRKKIMAIKAPTAVKLSRINLSGDLHHVSKVQDTIDEGELFLVRRIKDLSYKEFYKFDVLALPLFYKEMEIPEPVVFHLHQLKSSERLMYRNAYFGWRKSAIAFAEKGMQAEDFESFHKKWELEMFGINEPNSVKYRFQQKFILLNSAPFDENKFGPYPEQIQEEIKKGNERFHFVYEAGKVVARKDEEDTTFNNYIPTKEDLNWSVEEHLKKLLGKDKLRKIGMEK